MIFPLEGNLYPIDSSDIFIFRLGGYQRKAVCIIGNYNGQGSGFFLSWHENQDCAQKRIDELTNELSHEGNWLKTHDYHLINIDRITNIATSWIPPVHKCSAFAKFTDFIKCLKPEPAFIVSFGANDGYLWTDEFDDISKQQILDKFKQISEFQNDEN